LLSSCYGRLFSFIISCIFVSCIIISCTFVGCIITNFLGPIIIKFAIISLGFSSFGYFFGFPSISFSNFRP
jgi:hypothetical protein